MTLGVLVLGQLVMAAVATARGVISDEWPLSFTVAFLARASSVRPKPRSVTGALRALCQVSFMAASETRSWGRLGPAREGSTVDRSSETVLVKVGAGVASVRKS